MKPPPIEAYYRVWLALKQTEEHHKEFHRLIWAAKSESAYLKHIVAHVSRSVASEADKLAVLEHANEDTSNARVLASIASSITCWSDVKFSARLAALRESANLSIPDLARASGLSDDAIRLYEKGERGPTWDAVQKLAKSLGVSTDTFRSE